MRSHSKSEYGFNYTFPHPAMEFTRSWSISRARRPATNCSPGCQRRNCGFYSTGNACQTGKSEGAIQRVVSGTLSASALFLSFEYTGIGAPCPSLSIRDPDWSRHHANDETPLPPKRAAGSNRHWIFVLIVATEPPPDRPIVRSGRGIEPRWNVEADEIGDD